MPPKQLSKKFWLKFLSKTKLYFFIFLLTTLLFLLLLGTNSYFQLRKIQLEADGAIDRIIGLDGLKGRNLYLLSTAAIIDKINKNNPNLLVTGASKQFPDTLILKLKYVEPAALLKLNLGFAQLSADGKILKKIKIAKTSPTQKTNQLPIINFYQQLDFSQIKPGSSVDYEEIVLALFLLKKCSELDLKIESIDISGLNMIVFNVIEKKIIFSAEKNKDKLAFELEAINKQFKIEAKEYKMLDLRFAKPIVRF